MKNKCRDSIKVVALAFSVLFFIIVSYFVVDYFSNPKIVTLGEIGAINIDDLASVQVCNATNTYTVYDPSLICDTLSDLILKKRIGCPKVPDDHHAIWFIERNDRFSVILYLSNDYRQLWIVHPEQKGSNQFESNDEYYEVLNPEILFETDYSRLTTEHVLTEPQPTLNLVPEDVEQIEIELDGENILLLDLAVDIDAVCSLLNNMQLSGERPVTNWDCYLRFVIWFPNEQIVAISVSPDYTQCIIEVYHEVDGIMVCTAHVHTTVLNPTLFTSSNIILGITSDRTGEKGLSPSQMKSLFEEHLRGKNRSYINLQFLGHYFYDMENNMQYAPVCIDYTSRDGKVISENNLYLVGFTGSDTHWRVEGMASGEWGMSAGYYPNVAKFNDRYVVWTTRNDTHMKLSEDKSSSDPNATETNYLYKYRVTCQSGATYTWQAMDGAGVFVLSKGEQPIRVVPLDASYNEVAAFAFDKDQLQCVDVHTITEQIW